MPTVLSMVSLRYAVYQDMSTVQFTVCLLYSLYSVYVSLGYVYCTAYDIITVCLLRSVYSYDNVCMYNSWGMLILKKSYPSKCSASLRAACNWPSFFIIALSNFLTSSCNLFNHVSTILFSASLPCGFSPSPNGISALIGSL